MTTKTNRNLHDIRLSPNEIRKVTTIPAPFDVDELAKWYENSSDSLFILLTSES